MKYILVIGDGMAENPLSALGGRTPLEYAKKSVIDALAAKGTVGSVKTVPDGFSPGSDTAIMSIFGCPPAEYYTGRASLEAAAQDVFLAPGDAALRCNNVALSDDDVPFGEKLIISHSAGGISAGEAKELIGYLFSHPEFKSAAEEARMEVKPCDSYRHICMQRGTDIAGLVTIPPHDHLDEKVKDHLPYGCEDAAILIELMEKANGILAHHPVNEARRAAGKLPANGIWFWAHATAAALPDFVKQFGKSGAVISAVPLVQGIAKLAGLDVITVEGATGELDTNYEGKVSAALGALDTRDFVAVHVEAPDECTHNGDLDGKLEAIRRLDSRVVGPLSEGMAAKGEDYRMLIMSDHKTLIVERVHDGDPVPYLIYDSRADTGAGEPYTEAAGERGPFISEGHTIMKHLFEI